MPPHLKKKLLRLLFDLVLVVLALWALSLLPEWWNRTIKDNLAGFTIGWFLPRGIDAINRRRKGGRRA